MLTLSQATTHIIQQPQFRTPTHLFNPWIDQGEVNAVSLFLTHSPPLSSKARGPLVHLTVSVCSCAG